MSDKLFRQQPLESTLEDNSRVKVAADNENTIANVVAKYNRQPNPYPLKQPEMDMLEDYRPEIR